MGINPYTIMTQHLKQMKEFFDKLGRTDCPASPEKKNYKICEDSPLIKTFNCIVKFGEKKKTDYIKSLNR